MKTKKRAFSLIELIFSLMVIGIVASIAVPKLMDTKDGAQITAVKKDLTTIISSIRSYYMLNDSMSSLNDVITLNESIWKIDGTTATFSDGDSSCLTVSISEKVLSIDIDDTNSGKLCEKLVSSGIIDEEYDL